MILGMQMIFQNQLIGEIYKTKFIFYFHNQALKLK